MNPQPHPQIVLVLRHIPNPCVFAGLECPTSLLSSLRQPYQSIDLALQRPRTAANSNFANHPDLLNHIQNP
jgi:hypothetical protein